MYKAAQFKNKVNDYNPTGVKNAQTSFGNITNRIMLALTDGPDAPKRRAPKRNP